MSQTRYIGVDLAWGMRHQTGLAAVDDTGALITLTQRVDDDALVAWFDEYAPGPAVFGFDAPLIVNNPTGNRAAERLVGRYFGRYKAFAHSSNRGMETFIEGGRAMRLALRLDLDVDPHSTTERRCLEVYPHPAIVMLFGLDRILEYKNKRLRTLPGLRSEMLRLMDHLERLSTHRVRLNVAATDDWSQVRRQVETAPTKAALGRAEDSIDAVVCAYVALYSVRRPELTAMLGTVGEGYIITPVTTEIGKRITQDRTAGWPVTTLGRGQTCPMTADPVVLDPTELDTALAALPGWKLEQGALITAYAAPSAAAALALIAAIGEAAEAAGHHPDLDWRYDHVFVLTTTHQVGGKVTRLDAELAQQIATLAVTAGATAEPDQARVGG